MTEKSRRIAVFALYLFAVIAFSGCAGPVHKALDPGQIDAITQTDVRAMVETEVPSVQVGNSKTGLWVGSLVGFAIAMPLMIDEAKKDPYGGGGSATSTSSIVISLCGGTGILVDKVRESSHSRRAQKWLTPLLDQTPDVDYRKDFWDALLVTLRALPWLKVDQTDLSAQLPGKWKVGKTNLTKPKGEIPEDWLDEDLLLASSDYSFTPDGRHLVVASWVQFWTEPRSKPSYFAHYTYISDAVEAKNGEEALNKWAANGGELYREALKTGIQETMSMIRLDLPDPEGQVAHLSGQKAKVKALNAKGKRSSLRGEVLDQSGNRIIFRSNGGQILSFPMEETELQLREK